MGNQFTVFYAWQSDTDGKINKFFIRDALEKALARINNDPTIEDSPRLDHDTKNVAGIPEIASTILTKIDVCSVFLADLTMVGRTNPSDKEPKLLPNPNVTLELGYAIRSVGSEAIICVMNESFGPAKEQIFDLANRRWPITYNLASADASEKKSKQETLSKQIETALRTIIEQGIPDRRNPQEIRDEMILEQFKAAVFTFLSLFRFLLFHENQILPYSEKVVRIFELDTPLVNGGGVDFQSVDREIVQDVLSGRDLAHPALLTDARDRHLSFGEAILVVAEKLKNECKVIVQNFGGSGNPHLIKQIQSIENLAHGMKFHEDLGFLEFPESFVGSVADLFEHISTLGPLFGVERKSS